MPIKIHHGPPGSFKTSGAIGDDFLREAKAGRVIVTNVRGVSRERTLETFPDLPDSFDVIWVDDRTDEGREKLRTWFHWAPEGAYLFIDEAQDIWPRHWRDSDLAKLDYPGGRDAALRDNRPKDWAQAWDKHRHWNWDLVLTTPDIKKIRDDIRGIADGAYKHKDLALLGLGGRYIEGFHAPDDNPKSESNFYNIGRKKVPSYVWKLYDSTATGKFSATKSGTPLWKNPKLIFLVAVLLGSLGFAVYNGGSVLPSPVALVGGKAAPATGGQVSQGRINPAPGGAGSYVYGGPGGEAGAGRSAVTAEQYLAQYKPRIDGLMHTAPAYDALTQPAVVPEPVGCVNSKRTGCRCFTQQGTHYETTEEICRQIMDKGLFMAWKQGEPLKDQAKAPESNDQEVKVRAAILAQEDKYGPPPVPVLTGNDSTNPRINPLARPL